MSGDGPILFDARNNKGLFENTTIMAGTKPEQAERAKVKTRKFIAADLFDGLYKNRNRWFFVKVVDRLLTSDSFDIYEVVAVVNPFTPIDQMSLKSLLLMFGGEIKRRFIFLVVSSLSKLSKNQKR